MIDVDIALVYLDFVEERHRIWELRQAGAPGPWTDDPILAARKFTNVFRILDPGTQFIMTDLIADDPSARDTLLRCFLYRHTGRVEAWKYLLTQMGEYPTWENLGDTFACWQEYRGEGTVHIKKEKPFAERANRAGGYQKTIYTKPMFTGAYLVFPQSQERGTDKLESIVQLTGRLFDPDSPEDIVEDFLAAETQADRFLALRRNKGVADFMSMQVLTDWGYTPHAGVDREDEFVVCGPGARKGAQALDPTGKPESTLLWAVETLRNSAACPELRSPALPPGIQGRLPSYMDTQNTLCEFSKLVRFRGKPLTTAPYVAAHPGPQDPPVLPQHWL